jgi:hypothetical protein
MLCAWRQRARGFVSLLLLGSLPCADDDQLVGQLLLRDRGLLRGKHNSASRKQHPWVHASVVSRRAAADCHTHLRVRVSVCR